MTRHLTFSDVKAIHTTVTEATYFPTEDRSDHVRSLLEQLHRGVAEKWHIGVDTEYDTDDLERCNAHRSFPSVVSLAVPTDSWFGGYRVCQPYVFTGGGINLLRKWFSSPNPLRVAHNANVDRHVLENHFQAPIPHLVDTLTAMRYFRPTTHGFGLKDLGWSCLQYNWSDDYGVLWGNTKSSELVNNVAFLRYAQIDAAWCAELYQWIMKEMYATNAITSLQAAGNPAPNRHSS